VDSEARYSWRCVDGKFGVGSVEVLSLIPGGPTLCLKRLSKSQGLETEQGESAEGVVARADLCA
jgi:hypothetical protein